MNDYDDLFFEENKGGSATLEEQIKCVEREIGMRKRVYPNWVASHRMKQEKAEYEIKIMSEVLKTLKQLEELE